MTTFVSNIDQMPIEKYALYVLDIDGTVLPEHTNLSTIVSKDIIKRNASVTHTLKQRGYQNKVIFLTRRLPKWADQTKRQMDAYQFSYDDILYAWDKGEVLSKYLKNKKYNRIFFIDNEMDNLVSIAKHCPQVSLYHITLPK